MADASEVGTQSTAAVRAAAPRPDFLSRLSDWSDRVSPVVVKEVRQMVRGREFNYSFGISLAVGLSVAFLGGTDALNGATASGAWIFGWLMTCLTLIGLVIVPMGAFNALRSERAERTLDLITLTTLSPRRLVIGKVLAQGIKLVMLFAGLAPFMAMSFLLGGIDLVTILISLASLFMWSLWVCSACLFVSCLSRSRALSGLILVGMAIVFFIGRSVYFSMMYMPGSTVFMPGGFMTVSTVSLLPIASGTTRSSFWWSLAGMTAVCLTTMVNLILLAENRISLPTQDRVTALRIGFLVQFLIIIGLSIASIIYLAPGSPRSSGLELLGGIAGLQLAVVAAFTVTEDLAPSRVILSELRTPGRWHWPKAIFRPGGGRGAAYVLVQMILLMIVGRIITSSLSELHWLFAICSYISLFTGVPTCVGRMLAPRRAKTPYLRVGVLLFFPVLALAGDVLNYLLNASYPADGFSVYQIANPFRTLTNWPLVETNHWQNFVFAFGLIGLISYVQLIKMGQRMMHDNRQ
jgi:hypothetical protein